MYEKCSRDGNGHDARVVVVPSHKVLVSGGQSPVLPIAIHNGVVSSYYTLINVQRYTSVKLERLDLVGDSLTVRVSVRVEYNYIHRGVHNV